MQKRKRKPEIDELDLDILNLLGAEGTLTNLELSKRIELSQSATHTRRLRLFENGYVVDRGLFIDHAQFGYKREALINIMPKRNRENGILEILTNNRYILSIQKLGHGVPGEQAVISTLLIGRSQEGLSTYFQKLFSKEFISDHIEWYDFRFVLDTPIQRNLNLGIGEIRH